MNLLNDLCKVDFEKWLTESNHTPWTVFFDSLPDTVKYAYYVEWFDLQGIYTTVKEDRKAFNSICGDLMILNDDRDKGYWFNSRAEAIKASIIHANNLYNELHTNNNG